MHFTCGVINDVWPASVKDAELSIYLRELLKRSHTSYSVLTLGLFYLLKAKRSLSETSLPRRSIVLAALMLSCKYLQDKNYRASTWADISGIYKSDVIKAEHALFGLLSHKLYISQSTYEAWSELVVRNVNSLRGDASFDSLSEQLGHFSDVYLSPDLEMDRISRKRPRPADGDDNELAEKRSKTEYFSYPSPSLSSSQSSSMTSSYSSAAMRASPDSDEDARRSFVRRTVGFSV